MTAAATPAQKPPIQSPQEIAAATMELMVFPEIGMRLLRMIEEGCSDLAEFSGILRQDVALTAGILKMCNSGSFFRGAEVTEVDSALSRVGLNNLKNLVLSICIPKATAGMDNEILDISDFWLHSLHTATLASAIAASIKGVNPSTAFTAGLVHDIGQLVLFRQCPQYSKDVLDLCLYDESVQTSDAERAILGFTHQDIGEAVAREWCFPEAVTVCIANHHDEQTVEDPDPMIDVVLVANRLAEAAEVQEDGEHVLAGLSDALKSRIPALDEDLAALMETAREHFDEMRNMIVPANSSTN
ncbi:MAG: HDOD domain-containing protein [Granulosicoccus sp.]|nr:HDOD domain-containing protein [Granulosicoccus sp.]